MLSKTWKVQALDDFFKAPPSQRYIPENSQTEIGQFIRHKLYDSMHGWTAISKNFKRMEFPNLKSSLDDIQKRVKDAKKKNDHVGLNSALKDWSDMENEGKVVRNKDIFTFQAKESDYHSDHEPSLVERWNTVGFNSDDAVRGKQLGEKLQLLTEEANTAKGSGGLRYKPFVGPKFTSIIADGGIMNARNIDGKRFWDASGKQIN